MLDNILTHGIGHLLSAIFAVVTVLYALKTASSLSGGIFGDACKRLAIVAGLFSLDQILHFLEEIGIELGEVDVFLGLAISAVFCWILYDLGRTLKKQL